ncbi:SDR family NAD(P)-dependent oxidoreductase [Phenylobacterium sp.]|uniref:SDR family NAD(P)-dependent oxidoreductase n=1 Tax=Phenylobacterium sp. TaxID=1871053 RepID=UPI00122AC494|nr:SDR family NAD(P)-dependent oxidoreductase [Phenylobacterium sp.]THD64368.1 MAG: SDR family NAD(P)-dependent oxidoreductase [Phenylobacterium sp.]
MTLGAALVTGAARRVGAAFVRELAAMGRAVVIHHRAHHEDAAALAAEIEAAGGRALALNADLNDEADCARLIAEAFAAFPDLDVLVNSASTFSYDEVATVRKPALIETLASNLAAPLLLCQGFAEGLRAERGLVVNVLDQKVNFPNPDFFAYTVGKVALANLTPTLALALAPRVRVCGLSPGLALPSGAQTEADFHAAVADTPLGLSCTLEDLRRALRFIVETPSFTGQNLTVDGGESLLRRPRDVAFDVNAR